MVSHHDWMVTDKDCGVMVETDAARMVFVETLSGDG